MLHIARNAHLNPHLQCWLGGEGLRSSLRAHRLPSSQTAAKASGAAQPLCKATHHPSVPTRSEALPAVLLRAQSSCTHRRGDAGRQRCSLGQLPTLPTDGAWNQLSKYELKVGADFSPAFGVLARNANLWHVGGKEQSSITLLQLESSLRAFKVRTSKCTESQRTYKATALSHTAFTTAPEPVKQFQLHSCVPIIKGEEESLQRVTATQSTKRSSRRPSSGTSSCAQGNNPNAAALLSVLSHSHTCHSQEQPLQGQHCSAHPQSPLPALAEHTARTQNPFLYIHH